MSLDNFNKHEYYTQIPQEITFDYTKELLGESDGDEEKSVVDNEGNEDKKTKTEETIEIKPEILNEEMKKNLKDVSSMSLEEMEAELELYGVKIPEEGKNNIIKLKYLLIDARNIIASEDKNSNIVDFHIGTYIQGKSKYCTILAQLDTMSDKEIKDMIKIKKDFDNKISYYVTFPQDKGNDNATIEISEEELNLGFLTINENGQNRIIDDLPKGDKDVTLIIMAFIKKFGTDIVDNGDRQYETQNKFREPTKPKLKDNQYFEDIPDYTNLPPHSTISILNPDEIKRKGFDFRPQSKEELSWIDETFIEMKFIKFEASTKGATLMTLSNDKKVCITQSYMYISDGTLIPVSHAMSIRGYDEKSEELIVSGSEFNNISEVRIPREVFIFLETASPEGTPGVDKTPPPTE